MIESYYVNNGQLPIYKMIQLLNIAVCSIASWNILPEGKDSHYTTMCLGETILVKINPIQIPWTIIFFMHRKQVPGSSAAWTTIFQRKTPGPWHCDKRFFSTFAHTIERKGKISNRELAICVAPGLGGFL